VTCTGAGGSSSANVTVNVMQPAAPPPPPPAAAPREIFRLEGVYFDFDRATLKPEGRTKLDSAVTILNRFSEMRVEVQGHTDSIGTVEYNQRLSERRAQAVVDYLVSRGISATRLTSRGYSENNPVADNATDEGRALNRRVMLIEMR
jgi:OOP family OmpA-OmpF porin